MCTTQKFDLKFVLFFVLWSNGITQFQVRIEAYGGISVRLPVLLTFFLENFVFEHQGKEYRIFVGILQI